MSLVNQNLDHTDPLDPPPAYHSVAQTPPPPTTPPSYPLSEAQSTFAPVVPSVYQTPTPAVPSSTSILAALTPFTKIPYNPSLAGFGLTPTAWSSFTCSLYRAAAPSGDQQTLAWATGITSGFFAPGTGMLVGAAIWRHAVMQNVRAGVEGRVDGGIGGNEVERVLREWNEKLAPLGSQMRIEVIEGWEAQREAAISEDLNTGSGCTRQRVHLNGCQRGCGNRCVKRCHQKRACGGQKKCYSMMKRPMFRIVVERIETTCSS